jgi:tetratricopeptide (TPR) repeat protein
MLSGRNPSPEAALELARREMSDPYRRVVVREHLEAVHRRHPGHIEIIEALTEDDLQNDQPLVALARITKAILRRPRDGDLYLARARLMLALERPADAALDAQRAIAVSPETRDDAYEMLASLYMNAADPQAPIEAILARDAKGQTTPDDIALLARLVLQTGDKARARDLYERALAAGSELALLKNDLAFLLAESGEDLDRALALAHEAADARGARLAAADTLGFVYLQSGNYEAAFWQFRFVTEEASPPVAEYYYHLALALMKLERHADARDALAEALRIEPGYAPAASALRELDALREPTRGAATRAS